ncbi:hypothetical protein PV350_46465, partial [Streptomyces sp. PA03-6a]|nr:hypothetical protein [Streptomyces sp. PA03-6a]
MWTMQADSNTADLNKTILEHALNDPTAGPGTPEHRRRLQNALDSHRPAPAAAGRAAEGGQILLTAVSSESDTPDTTSQEAAAKTARTETRGPALASGGVPRPATGRVPGTPDEDSDLADAVTGGAEAVAGDSDGSDDGATVVGDGEATAAGGDADDVTVVGEDAAAGGAGAERDKSGLPEPGDGHDKVRAWLAGQSPDLADPYKAVLLDPESRFPAETTAHPAAIWPPGIYGTAGARGLSDGEHAAAQARVRGWLAPASDQGWLASAQQAAGRAAAQDGSGVSDGDLAAVRAVVHEQAAAQAAARVAVLLGRFRSAQAAAVGGSVGDLVVIGRQLEREGVDVFRSEWAALPVAEQTEVTALVVGAVGPEDFAGWDTRDVGAVAVARRSGQAAADAVIRHVSAERARLRSQP